VLDIAVEVGTSSQQARENPHVMAQRSPADDLGLSLAAAGVGAVRSRDALAVELHDRVMAIRQAVDTLSTEGAATEEEETRRETWSMLSFALEDWC
jgi:hypothetical protein